MDSRYSMEGQGLNLSTTMLPRPKIYDRQFWGGTPGDPVLEIAQR